MNAIGLLVTEHRLIEKMVALLSSELENVKSGKASTEFMRDAVDFFRSYADRVHHGKEEDILFRQLAAKPMSDEHRKTMEQLIAEHIIARENVKGLSEANERHAQGDNSALEAMGKHMQKLIALYPPHIKTEDQRFFVPVMKYFSQDEQAKMLQECLSFDQQAIHERYKKMVEGYSKK